MRRKSLVDKASHKSFKPNRCAVDHVAKTSNSHPAAENSIHTFDLNYWNILHRSPAFSPAWVVQDYFPSRLESTSSFVSTFYTTPMPVTTIFERLPEIHIGQINNSSLWAMARIAESFVR